VNCKVRRSFTFIVNENEWFENERYCKVIVEGKKEDLFDPGERDEETEVFKEPKIKWRKSKAKEIPTNMIIQEDSSTPIDDIFMVSMEFCK
jgi:nitroimidazol reductase NimA-like FMN-containing flavoprotein (pyridoxamine 5'-phosphate oxidase superfamily)